VNLLINSIIIITITATELSLGGSSVTRWHSCSAICNRIHRSPSSGCISCHFNPL